MGTAFDAVEPETATRFYEELRPESLSREDEERRANRRLLYGVMTEADFSNYPEEWWHYDFGNQFDAARSRRQAIYGAAELSAKNRLFEKLLIVAHHAYLNQGEIVEINTDGGFHVNEYSLLPGGFPANTVHPSAVTL